MVSHPSCLERRVLAVVGKDEKTLPLGIVEHVLGEHVHV
jgi:hypothetical protein